MQCKPSKEWKRSKRRDSLDLSKIGKGIPGHVLGGRVSISVDVKCFVCRLKAGLKLHEEAEKIEVEKGIHLLQDPEGIFTLEYKIRY